jgi:serine protease Do
MNIFSRVSFISLIWMTSNFVQAQNIQAVVAKVKPSVVGVGLYDAMGVQTHQLRGTVW